MKKVLAAAGLALLAMNAVASTINIENESSWEIHELYFAPSSQDDWGDDHLGEQVLKPGMSLTLTGVTAGKWDVRLVDEDKDECIVKNQKISSSETFSIGDDDLLGCQATTEE
ncbi:hypothetical protein [Pseudomonas fluorescens]|uniref:Uncharacterized protein n=1 Tax=Pseudomonas fluorescens TaxID=294 RepID=A0A5E7FVR6_PSEFL|nr:hypothetical protein [Pseudomonas fluorescens]VVO43440.1 hypothetical protein PS723_06179 [Pseudomonas fluorescens]